MLETKLEKLDLGIRSSSYLGPKRGNIVRGFIILHDSNGGYDLNFQ